jgi:hypothetical protein
VSTILGQDRADLVPRHHTFGLCVVAFVLGFITGGAVTLGAAVFGWLVFPR